MQGPRKEFMEWESCYLESIRYICRGFGGMGGMEVFGGGWVLKFVFDYVVD